MHKIISFNVLIIFSNSCERIVRSIKCEKCGKHVLASNINREKTHSSGEELGTALKIENGSKHKLNAQNNVDSLKGNFCDRRVIKSLIVTDFLCSSVHDRFL